MKFKSMITGSVLCLSALTLINCSKKSDSPAAPGWIKVTNAKISDVDDSSTAQSAKEAAYADQEEVDETLPFTTYFTVETKSAGGLDGKDQKIEIYNCQTENNCEAAPTLTVISDQQGHSKVQLDDGLPAAMASTVSEVKVNNARSADGETSTIRFSVSGDSVEDGDLKSVLTGPFLKFNVQAHGVSNSATVDISKM